MENENNFEVIIIGGSYAGLSAGLTLARSLRKVLIVDSGFPCNLPAKHTHNFITQEGQDPRQIAEEAKAEISKYDTVQFLYGLAMEGKKIEGGFEIKTQADEVFTCKKILFATGMMDLMPQIPGFEACWGKTILHCVYCDAYEVRNEKAGIMSNGYGAFVTSRVVDHWCKDLTIFTNGASTISSEQQEAIDRLDISVIEKKIAAIEHENGNLKSLKFEVGSSEKVSIIFTAVHAVPHCDIPMSLGCETLERGFLKIDQYQKTSVDGIYAAGDNTSSLRTVARAVGAGMTAGVYINKELIEDEYK